MGPGEWGAPAGSGGKADVGPLWLHLCLMLRAVESSVVRSQQHLSYEGKLHTLEILWYLYVCFASFSLRRLRLRVFPFFETWGRERKEIVHDKRMRNITLS